tara:strand:- start:3826 stop:5187 length:1362 start_codon:yes stop_codon:yes gene_type:complete
MYLNISIPNNFIEERTYTISTLIRDLLGLPYELSIHENPSTEISFNKKNIIIVDSFFNKYASTKNYLHENNLPKSIKKIPNPFKFTENLISIYGDGPILIEDHKITCNLDIIASTFFMLTRWEEYVLNEKDQFSRFNDLKSCAYKFNFYERPIVNEYIECIWKMLKKLEFPKERKQTKFSIFHSHDIDHLNYWSSPWKFLKSSIKYTFFNKNIPFVVKSLKEYPLSFFNPKKDPYYTYDYLMNKSEELNTKSHFYFMSGGITKYDSKYSITTLYAKKIFKNIKKRGHIIGFHPSFNTYNNQHLFNKELSHLQSIIKEPVEYGRQHYLRFEVPTTWQIWEDNNLKQSSSCGYPLLFGFRLGICLPFHPFNILTKQKLSLLEKPLLVMDATLTTALHQKKMLSKSFEKIDTVLNQVKKYNGTFSLLWHNGNLFLPEWYSSIKSYENLLTKCKEYS